MMFISKPVKSCIYIAERSRKGSRKLLWSAMPEAYGGDVRVQPRDVPLAVRREAYKLFEADRKRDAT